MSGMQMTKILPAAVLGLALGVLAIPVQAQRHFTPATHRSFRPMKQKSAKAKSPKKAQNKQQRRNNARVN